MEIYNLLHIKSIQTTAYHPQTDGLIERFNKTLKTMLRKYATESGKEWDKLLPYLLFVYREVPQSSTEFSPFELLYGRSVRGPLDVLRETWEAGEKSEESVVSYVLAMQELLEKMTEHVKENLGKAQTQQKKWYDKQARMRTFKSGDQVLLLLPIPTSKLMAQWQGPYSTTLAEQQIKTGSSSPIHQPPYQLAHAYRDAIKKELDEMQKCGIIEPSSSEWASPMVIVKKKDGTIRLCVDYRRVNSLSAADAYPLPRIDDIIDRIGTAKYITTIDLMKGYWQVPVIAADRHKTAFATPFRLFQFNVMPFGLQGALGTFQRMINRLLQRKSSFTAAYLDDLVIFSTSCKEHIWHLRLVMERLRSAGLTARPKKCQFGMAKFLYLGHVVKSGMVQYTWKQQRLRQFDHFPFLKQRRSCGHFWASQATTGNS